MLVAVAIGSNIGNRERNILFAYHGLQSLPKSKGFTFSPIYTTTSVGFDGAPEYLNAVALFSTLLSPEDLLKALLSIEAQCGRRRSIPNAPRTLDLDILFFGDEIISTPDLTIPHPRLHERSFVLVPLNDVAPDLRHPKLGVTIKDLLSDQALVVDQVHRYEFSFGYLLMLDVERS